MRFIYERLFRAAVIALAVALVISACNTSRSTVDSMDETMGHMPIGEHMPMGENDRFVNPIPPNTASVRQGELVYQQHCLACHGPKGKGDGPVGITLNPRPADLSVHAAHGGHTDGQLFEWISFGVEGSIMPAFEGVIEEDDRWHLVNYIRTFASLD